MMDDEIFEVYDNDKFLFALIGIKNILIFTPNDEEIEVIEFKTSTGIDFVKINTDKSMLGIFTESAWANYTYPGFEKVMQSLYHLKINDVIFPCDLIIFKNNETAEEISIYFEISEFFGKF